MANGLVELTLYGRGEHEYVATIRDIVLAAIPEAVALLALDLAELYNLGVRPRASSNKAFQRAVLQLAGQLRKVPGVSSSEQLDELAKAETLRTALQSQFSDKAEHKRARPQWFPAKRATGGATR